MADPQVRMTVDLLPDETKFRQAMNRLEQQMRFKGPFAGMAADTSKFTHELDRATQRVITLGTAFQLLSAANRTIREIARSTLEVEKSLTDINSVFRLTNENLSKFSGNLFNIARETAKSFDEVAKAATEFARQGLSVTKTQEAVRAALILSRDANIDVAVSVRALTAAVNSFQKEGITYSQVINRLAAADSAFAVSSKDLQEALIRVGSAASDAGVSFNELTALVTSAQQITARGGSVIAGALNTIFTRINRRDTLDALESLGVAVTDVQGRMLPTLTVLQNFSKAYDRMTGSVKNQAAELVGGVRQLNTLKAVLDDLAKTNSVFAQSLSEVENARDNAERRNAARNQSLAARVSQLQETGRQIGANIGTIGFESQAKGALGALNNNFVAESLRNAGDLTNESFGAEAGRTFIKGFGGAITFGLTPLIAGVFYQLSKNVFGNLLRDVKDITFMKNEARERAALEQQIVALYQAGGAPLQQQLATMTSLTEQAAVFAAIMKSVSGAGIQSRAIADILMSQRARTPRAAGGYIPMGEEAAAIARGTGGAPPNARPVFLPGFNRGGGQKGIVANTSEFIVPNLAGGSAIYNREMIQKYGLPPGATPVAAEGFIPNAAKSWFQPAVPPTTALEAAIRRIEQKDAEENALVASILSRQVIVPKSSTDYANSMLTGASIFAPGGSIGNAKRASDFAKAEAEIIAQRASAPSNWGLSQQHKNIISAEEAFRAEERARQSQKSAPRIIREEEKILAEYKKSNPEKYTFTTTPYPSSDIPRGFFERRAYRRSQVDAKHSMAWMADESRQAGIIAQNERLFSLQERLKKYQDTKYGPFLPPGWTPPPSNYSPPTPSVWSRISGRITPASSMLLAMGLPFVGSNIPDAPGGTTRGMLYGGLSSGLNAAGFGASAGLMIGGPTGSLIGAGIGGIAGGIFGVLGKLTKSFEELSAELDKSKKQLTENYDKASQFFRLQEELQKAKDAGNVGLQVQIQRQQTQLLASVPSDLRGKMLAWKNDPNAQNKMAIEASRASINEDIRSSFVASLSKISSGDISSEQDKLIAFGGLTRVMSAMTPDAIKSLESQVSKGNIQGALSSLAAVAGGGDAEVQKIIQKLSKSATPSMLQLALQGILPGVGIDPIATNTSMALKSALSDVLPIFSPNGVGPSGPPTMSRSAISDLLSGYRMKSAIGGFSGAASGRLAQAEYQQILALPTTERNRLFRSGQIDLQEIERQASIGRAGALTGGREAFVSALQGAGIRAPDAFDAASGLTSRDAFAGMLADVRSGKVGGSFDTVKRDQLESALLSTLEKYDAINEEEKINLEVTKKINKIKMQMFNDERDHQKVRDRIFAASKDEAERAEALAKASALLINTPGVSGNTIESGLMSGAVSSGSYGNAGGSFLGGFRARFAGLRRDITQFAEIGNRVAQSLESNLGNAFGDFVTGATTAKNAFRSFAISVLSDASRMFASKAFQTVLSTIPGFTPMGATGGEFTGSGFRFASGGMVPALLTGGEFYIGPRAAKRIGYDTLRQLNKYAEGGMVRGGSGVKDDVPARLPPGSFIIRKSATERLGPDYLQALVDGKVQGRFLGGFLGMPMLYGALLGGGLGALVGGKKGALIGAGIGALGGGLYGMSSSPSAAGQASQTMLNVSTPSPDLAATAAEPATMMDPFKVSAGRVTSSSISPWKMAAYGLGAAAVLGMAARAISPKEAPGPISAAQVPAFRGALEAQQNQLFSSNRYAYLSINPQGGYSLGSFGPEPATRRWAEGGGVDLPMVPGPHSGPASSNAPQVSVKIEINNNGQTSSKSSSTSEGGPFGADFGTKLEKAIRPIVQDELVRQSRNDGFFSQRSRYVTT